MMNGPPPRPGASLDEMLGLDAALAGNRRSSRGFALKIAFDDLGDLGRARAAFGAAPGKAAQNPARSRARCTRSAIGRPSSCAWRWVSSA